MQRHKWVATVLVVGLMVVAAIILAAGCSSGGSTNDGGTVNCGASGSSCGGSCVDLQTDNANCGACGTACGAGMVCSQGKCGVTCGGGTKMCGSSCTDTAVDPNNCGTCGMKCSAGQICSNGSCASTCGSGQSLCPGDGGAPYCASTMTDNANCGACGTTCGLGEVCRGGTCSGSCGGAGDGGAEVLCTPDGGAPYCADTQSDNANCGGCGTACVTGQVCQGGMCSNSCPSSDGGLETLCQPDAGAPYCADLSTDNANCGVCGTTCTKDLSCVGGKCSSTFIFPATSDTWSKGTAAYYWTAGDSISGTRATSLASAASVSGNVQISSNILTSCGTDTFNVQVNGTTVGSFTLTMGMTSVPVSATFSPITGPVYTITYVVGTSVTGGCGSVQFKPDVGSLTLGP